MNETSITHRSKWIFRYTNSSSINLNPEIKIITIIRAKNKSNALERLKRAWYDWPELIESLQDKVEVLPGDITKKILD